MQIQVVIISAGTSFQKLIFLLFLNYRKSTDYEYNSNWKRNQGAAGKSGNNIGNAGDHSSDGSAKGLMNLLPAIIFVIGCLLAFATGTSWGTFGILIPIVVNAFQSVDPDLMIIAISACMAGAVCGDHCSPISDTTIMASAGAQSNHINHVSTQLPYALLVAGVSFVMYILAGFVQSVIVLPIAIAVMIGMLFLIKYLTKDKSTSAKA